MTVKKAISKSLVAFGLIGMVNARPVSALSLVIPAGGTYSISVDGLVLGIGDAIICNGLVNSNAVTIDVDASTPALGILILPAIQISNNVPVTIRFNGAANLVLGNGVDTAISISGGGSLTVTNAGGATGGFVFSGNTNKILTITGPIGGSDTVNRIMVGDNTLRTTTSAVTLNAVTIGGANAKLDVDVATTIGSLTVTAGEDADIDIASGLTATITNAATLSGDSILEVIAVTGGAAETLAMPGGLTLSGTSQLRFTNDGGVLSGTVTSGADTAVVDVSGMATISTLTPTNSINLDVAAGKQLTITNPVTVPAAKTVTFTGTNDASAETLTLSGGLILNGLNAELNITGDNTTAQIIAGTVTDSTDGGVVVVDASASVTAVNMAAGAGELTLEVAPGKTLTTTVDVNDNTLTLGDTGTVSTVQLDTSGGTVRADANGTITTLTETADGSVNLGNGVNLTITNPFNVGANKLTLTGSGGGAQDTFTATVQLNNAASELEINGADADNIAGTTVTVTADGATLDTNINAAPTAVNLTAGAGDLTLEVASGKTLTTTVDVKNNTLIIAEGGTVSTVQMDTAGGVVQANANGTITTLTETAAASVNLGNGVNLTVTNPFNVGANKLTLNGSGGGTQDTFTATVQLNNASSELEINGADADNITGTTVTVTADGATLDANINTTPIAVNMTAGAGDLTLEIAAGKTMTTTVDVNNNTLTLAETGTISAVQLDTANSIIQANESGTITTLDETAAAFINLGDGVNLTVANPFSVGANKLTLTGSGGGAQDTFTATVQLNNASSELEIGGADADNITGTTVAVSADGATLNANINTSPTAINMTAGAGQLTLEVASGKTLTTTVDVNDNTLTLGDTGTVSTVQLDTSGGTVQANASGTITTLAQTAAGFINLGNGVNLTVTNPFNVGASKLTLNGSGGGAQDMFTATVQLNNAASELEIGGADADSIAGTTVAVSADGATLDVNVNAAPIAVNMTAGAGDLTLEVASGKTLTTTVDVNDNTLTIAEGGSVSTVQMDTAAGVLDVNESATVTALSGTADFTIDVAAGKTLTTTASIGSNNLTLTGTGTISRIDATTPTITDNGGTTISDLRATFGVGGTVTWSGTGNGTITTLASGLPGAGETLNKVGTGSLTIASGFTTAFANAAGVILDINGGTVIIGSPGVNDDLTLDDDADEITIADGATLTTFGSLSVGAAGANVNFDAAPGSMINLNSADGAETITSAVDNDYNLLGTVNINGSNGDYSIADAFEYQFGSININSAGGFTNAQPNGEMKFVPDSVITVNGTFEVNGQASGTSINLDTTTGTNSFSIVRGSSGTLVLDNVILNQVSYVSDNGLPAQCSIDLSGITFGAGTVNWLGSCGGGGSPPIGDGDTGNGTVDETPPDDSTGDAGQGPSTPLVVEGQIGADGTVDLDGQVMDGSAGGFDPGTQVSIITGESNLVTLTIGDSAAPLVVASVENAAVDSRLQVVKSDSGVLAFTLTQGESQETITVDSTGLSQASFMEVRFAGDGTRLVTAITTDGNDVTVGALGLAGGYEIVMVEQNGGVVVRVSDPLESSIGVEAESSPSDGDTTFTIEYEPSSQESSGGFVSGFPGLRDGKSLGGSLRVTGTPPRTGGFFTVSIFYSEAALSAQAETGPNAAGSKRNLQPLLQARPDETQLRMVRFDEGSEQWIAPGDDDQGVSEPTRVLGHHGVDVNKDRVWAHVATLGRFAIGFPANETDASTVIGEGSGTFQFGNRFCGSCGATGILPLPLIGLSLLSMRLFGNARLLRVNTGRRRGDHDRERAQ